MRSRMSELKPNLKSTAIERRYSPWSERRGRDNVRAELWPQSTSAGLPWKAMDTIFGGVEDKMNLRRYTTRDWWI